MSSHFETVKQFLADSFHQHFDAACELVLAYLVLRGDTTTAVFAATGVMLGALGLLFGVRKVAPKLTAHRQAWTPLTFHDVQFEVETIALLRDYQAAHETPDYADFADAVSEVTVTPVPATSGYFYTSGSGYFF